MSLEVQRIRQLLERTYAGDAWHGPSVRVVLSDLSAAQALQRTGGSHNSVEIVQHMTAWRNFAIQRLEGTTDYEVAEEINWSSIHSLSEADWQQVGESLDQSQHNLLTLLDSQEATLLNEPVASRLYDYYVLLHGIIQHDLYHLGQIRLLSSHA